jgi:hypothetical protein
MGDAIPELEKIGKAVSAIQELFEQMQLTPAEGLAVLAMLRDRTVDSMIEEFT